MSRSEIEAREIVKGDVLVGGDRSEREVIRVKVRATSVTVLLEGMRTHTFRNVHELVTVIRASKEA